VPGFLVFGVFAGLAVGGEDDIGLAVGGFDGDDVPGVGGDDVGGDEVDFFGGVGDVVGADGADVGVVAFADGGLDLDAAEQSAVVGGDVVGGVAEGLGGEQVLFGGTGDETHLGPGTPDSGVAEVHSFTFH